MNRPNRKLKRIYDQLYQKDPLTANVHLLLSELADDEGLIYFETECPEEEIQLLLGARFNDPYAYQLPRGETA